MRRGARSRQAIIAALWDLIGGGELQPTAQQVATRAGVGIATCFESWDRLRVDPQLTVTAAMAVLARTVLVLLRDRPARRAR